MGVGRHGIRSAGYNYIPVTTGQTVQIDSKYWARVRWNLFAAIGLL
jgi:hypothetical protein